MDRRKTYKLMTKDKRYGIAELQIQLPQK